MATKASTTKRRRAGARAPRTQPPAAKTSAPHSTQNNTRTTARPSARRAPSIVAQLEEIEGRGGDGTLDFGRGGQLHVSSLDKIYFPSDGYTKGDIMRYYAAVAPFLLPIIKDRPLVLKRFPNGIEGSSFFQQNAGDELPPGVRTDKVATLEGGRAERIIGGDLLTLLYTVQIGTIAVHSWQTRLTHTESADTTTVDLDPGDDVPFSDVVALARRIKAILDKWDLRGSIKTSGSSGLHIVLPLPPNSDFDQAAAIAERIAERVVDEHPDRATIERGITARPRGTIYVDAQQNAKGKTVVAAYSIRERARATVSAPLDWRELRSTLRLESFTLKTMPARLKKVGDLWSDAMKRRNTRRAIDRVLRGA
jgi:bifunctional non-homologous end joining protein LigD